MRGRANASGAAGRTFLSILVATALATSIAGIVIGSILIARPSYSGVNIGSTGIGPFDALVGYTFQFHKVAGGSDAITTSLVDDSIAVDLSETGIVPGVYVAPTITVDAQGRLLSASNTTTVVVNVTTGDLAVMSLNVTGATVLGASTTCNAAIDGSCIPTMGGDITGSFGSNQVRAIQTVPVDATAPANGQVLTYNGTYWVPKVVTDVDTLAGDVTGPLGVNTVTLLQSVPLSAYTPAAGNVLTFNGTYWIAQAPVADVDTLAGDVTGTIGMSHIAAIQAVPVDATSPATGNLLTYNGTFWVARAPATTTALAGDMTGTLGANTLVSIQAIPVQAPAPVNGQVLTYNGTYWVPIAPTPVPSLGGDVTGTIGANTVSKLQTVPLSAPSPASGNLLTYNGSYWIAAPPAAPVIPSLAGDVTGTLGSNTLSSIQASPLSAPTPVTNGVLLFNGTYWIPQLSTNLNTPSTLVSRDANGNSSFGVVATNSIQSNSPTTTCMGLGPRTIVDNRYVYVATSNPYYAAPVLYSYDTVATSLTTIGTLANYGANGNRIAVSPAGALYTFDNSNLYLINTATAATIATTPFTPTISTYGGAFHANGDLYLLHYTSGVSSRIYKYNFTSNTVSIYVSTYVAGDYPSFTIIGDWFYVLGGAADTIQRIYIPDPTVTFMVTSKTYQDFPYYDPPRLFTYCKNGAAHLGISSYSTLELTFADQTNGNFYDLFNTTGLAGVMQGVASVCFQATSAPLTCSTGSMDMAHNVINRTDALYVDSIFANTRYPAATRVITLQNNANFASTTATLGFNNDTFLSRSSAGVLSTATMSVTTMSATTSTARHYVPTNAAIPTAVAGTGAGTGPTITVTAGSTDCKMQITVLTGTGPTGGATVFTLTYNLAFTGTVNKGVVFSAAGPNAAALSGTTSPYVSSETLTNFVFTAGSAGLAATTSYTWNFQVCA